MCAVQKAWRSLISRRLGRFQLSLVDNVVEATTVNVVALALDTGKWPQSTTDLLIDGTALPVPTQSQTVYFTRPNTHSEWKVVLIYTIISVLPTDNQ